MSDAAVFFMLLFLGIISAGTIAIVFWLAEINETLASRDAKPESEEEREK
jgi:hypothetical protein